MLRPNLRRSLFSLCFLIGASMTIGCAAAGHLNTASGHPEVTVNSNVKVAQKACLGWLLSNGYVVGSQIDTKDVILAGGKDVTPGMVSAFGNGTDIERVLFNFFDPDSTHTTIYATKEITKTRNGVVSLDQRNSQDDLEELQGVLTTISKQLAAKPN